MQFIVTNWYRDHGLASRSVAGNTEAMNLHLAEIAEMVAPGAHAVLLVDQAGWHLSARLLIPANITILALPPKSPELNPVENVWQFMRDNWTAPGWQVKTSRRVAGRCSHVFGLLMRFT